MRVWEEHQREGSAVLENHGFVDEQTMGIYKWLEWVVMRNHPLAEVDDPLTRAIVNLKPISSRKLLAYVHHVAAQVGKKIEATMGERFGLMFDGWTSGTMHFVAMYAVCVNEGQRQQPLLAISPAVEGQSAAAHVEMIENVLAVYKKRIDMLCFIIGDNCATNKAIADRLNVPLVGSQDSYRQGC
ncbi:hypothetical protein ATCC90586_010662 [Pythium insidiosum]|nr:hypothetical protein ATCC90586_010662 [Pythium insidiosum]